MEKIIEFNKPCAVVSDDGYHVDIILFEEEDDAEMFHLEFCRNDTCESEYGICWLYLDGKVNVEHLDEISVLYWTHEDLAKYMDDMYNRWLLNQKGLKYDAGLNQYVPRYETASDYGYDDFEDYDPPFDNLPF